MKKTTFLIAGLASSLVLTGCTQPRQCCTNTDKVPVAQVEKPEQPVASKPIVKPMATPTQAVKEAPAKKPELLKVTGIGYGAESTFAAYTPGQRRLMAIRSSKLDAYRALAEQLYGIKIDSNTSVSTLTAKNDSFRARVNAVVRGARVVSVTPMADRNYETVLEVYVDKKFFEEAFVYTGSRPTAVEPEAAYNVKPY